MKSHVFLAMAVVAAFAAAAACGGTSVVSGSSGAIPDPDAGAGEASTDDGAAPPEAGTTDPAFNTPAVCTSMTMWTRGDRGSSSMHPGAACITCHAANRGPNLSIAGTVYPTAHEPIDCNGVAANAQVVITDAKGTVTTIAVNAAGNFSSAANIQMPFHAKVVVGGKERAMVAAQTTGDCNSCHTQTGANSAPGRIVAP